MPGNVHVVARALSASSRRRSELEVDAGLGDRAQDRPRAGPDRGHAGQAGAGAAAATAAEAAVQAAAARRRGRDRRVPGHDRDHAASSRSRALGRSWRADLERPGPLRRHRSTASTRRRSSDVFFVGAIAAAGFTACWYFWKYRQHDEKPSDDSPTRRYPSSTWGRGSNPMAAVSLPGVVLMAHPAVSARAAAVPDDAVATSDGRRAARRGRHGARAGACRRPCRSSCRPG